MSPKSRCSKMRQVGCLTVTICKFSLFHYEAFCMEFPDVTGWGMSGESAMVNLIVTLTELGLINDVGQIAEEGERV